MSTKRIIELYHFLSDEELKILRFKYKDDMSIKFALCRMLDKATSKECEEITMSDKWFFKDSVPEVDESEEEAV